MTEFPGPGPMQHLRQVLAITFLASILGGCSYTRHWAPERCTEPIRRFERPSPKPEPEPEPALFIPKYQPVEYRLDKHRTLEVWDTEANGHFSFLQDGKVIRTKHLLYCSAAPLISNFEDTPNASAVCLTGTKSRFVVVCQQGDDHYLYSVFKVASGFRQVGEFQSKCPLDYLKVGDAYRFSGCDYLPGFGAQEFAENVLFKFEKGKLKLDRRSMRKQLPTETQLREIRQSIRAKFKEPADIPIELFDTVFAFYYCGEVERAREFYNSVYPKNLSQKAYWWHLIEKQIRQSQYYKEFDR